MFWTIVGALLFFYVGIPLIIAILSLSLQIFCILVGVLTTPIPARDSPKEEVSKPETQEVW